MISLTDGEIKNSFEVKQGLHELIVGRWVVKAQLKKVVEVIKKDNGVGFDGFNQSPVIISYDLWHTLLKEVE